jgi:glutathione S-transferase
MSLHLYVGNYNYSSWSMRAGVLLQQSGLAFETIKLRFDSFQPDSQFKNAILKLTPTGRVPVLLDAAQQAPLLVWDSLAIAEYVAELAAQSGVYLWPQSSSARARARSVCAEMHSGFTALRSALPMNIEAQLPEIGALVMRDKPAVVTDLQRLINMWSELLSTYASSHPDGMLFGAFSVADAYFAPVVMRIKTYALPVPAVVAAYMDRVCALSGVQHWLAAALAEHDFLDFEEPYRVSLSRARLL